MAKAVMIVDDSNTVRASVEYTLSKEGYEVIKAINGKDGLDKLVEADKNRKEVFMIISDVNMPVMDGITFIQEVKKMDKFKFIPILVLTTEAGDERKLEGRKAGACGWLVKPFEPEQLVGVVKKFVK